MVWRSILLEDGTDVGAGYSNAKGGGHEAGDGPQDPHDERPLRPWAARQAAASSGLLDVRCCRGGAARRLSENRPADSGYTVLSRQRELDHAVCCRHAARVPTAYSAVVIPESAACRSRDHRLARHIVIESPSFTRRPEEHRTRKLRAVAPIVGAPSAIARPLRPSVDRGTSFPGPVDWANDDSTVRVAPRGPGHSHRKKFGAQHSLRQMTARSSRPAWPDAGRCRAMRSLVWPRMGVR